MIHCFVSMPDDMNRRTPIRFGIIIPLIIISCAGCLNYEQETYLNDDLSGRTEVRVFPNPKPVFTSAIQKTDTPPEVKRMMGDIVDKAAFKVNIQEEDFYGMVNKDHAKNGKFTKSEQDGTTCFLFVTEFDDIRKLYEGKRKVSVTEDPDGLVTYTEYFYNPGDGKKGDNKKDGNPELYKGRHFKYVLHMPREIIRANTDKIDKNTATWELPLDVVDKNRDFHITATMKGKNRWPCAG